jgi:hypothetical protein
LEQGEFQKSKRRLNQINELQTRRPLGKAIVLPAPPERPGSTLGEVSAKFRAPGEVEQQISGSRGS